MAEPSKAAADRPHTIRWDPADWDRIEEAAKVLAERQHMDLAAVDIIRSGTRRFVDEILTSKPDSERRGGERRKSA